MPNLPTTRQKPPAAPGTLAQAFGLFTRAADSLENFYTQLQIEVAHLRQQLERTNRDLARSLEENQRMRAYLGRILESLPCGVMVLDAAGSLRWVNPEARRILSIESEACREPARSPSETLQRFLAASSFQDGGGEQEWSLAGPDGIRYLGVTRTSVPGGNGSGQERVYILRDVTNEKRLQQDQEAARRVQALAEVATLLAHEIRNPLGSLELFAGLLADSVDSESEEHRWVDQLQAGLRALSATVNNVLEFHRQPAAERVPVNLVRLLAETVEFLAPLARQSKTRIEFVRENDEASVWAEPHGLRQVFLNLAINAFRAMSPGGDLRIGVEVSRQGPARSVQIEFTDQGKGIPGESLEKIFEAGFSTHPNSPGLGLAVSKRIVEQHGGTIGVRSGPGQGTTFTLSFPALGGAG